MSKQAKPPAARSDWTPEFEGQRPPFREGNLEAAIHGGHSRRLVEPLAQEKAPEIFEAHPHLDPARDGPAVLRYAILLARIKRVYGWFASQGDPVFADREAGKAHPIYERLERWERQAAEAEDKLALSPLTRARLGLDTLRAQATLEDFKGRGPESEGGEQS